VTTDIAATGNYLAINGNAVLDDIVVVSATGRTTVSGNSANGDLDFTGDDSALTGNVSFGKTDVVGDDLTVQGNRFAGTFQTLGDRMEITGNYFNTTVNIGITATPGTTQTGLLISSNKFNGSVNVDPDAYLVNCVFSDNQCGGLVDLSGNLAPLECQIVGNDFASTFDAHGAQRCTFSGNRGAGNWDLTLLDDCAITGNVLWDNSGTPLLDVSNGNDLTVTGNQVAGEVTATGADGSTFGNNKIGGDLKLDSANDYIVTGNRVLGEIIVPAGASDTNGGIIMGNRAQNIGDSASGAMPTNYVVCVGNKVNSTTTAGVQGQVFATTPVTASAMTLNIKDDADI